MIKSGDEKEGANVRGFYSISLVTGSQIIQNGGKALHIRVGRSMARYYVNVPRYYVKLFISQL